MSNILFTKKIDSIEPQIFRDGVDTSIFFTKEIEIDPPGLLNSVLVQNAGESSVNGVYNYLAPFIDKPYYYNNENLYIIYLNNLWSIYNFSIDDVPIYFSNENVSYPWNVSNWQVQIGYSQAPIVTKIL